MLYLLEDIDCYKIGTSKNVEDRMKRYNTHNIHYKLIDMCPGNKKDEEFLHDKLKDLRLSGEWFKKDQRVLDVWNAYKEFCNDIEEQEEETVETKLPQRDAEGQLFYTFYENFHPNPHLTDNPFKTLIWLCRYMEYNTGRISLTANKRKQLAEEAKVCVSGITAALRKLKESKMIVGEKGEFMINPAVFWKGDLKKREELLHDPTILEMFDIKLIEE